MKKLRMREGFAVPFLITKKVVQREPTAEVKSRFVGVTKGLWNLGSNVLSVAKVILTESFFEELVEKDDGGVVEEKHFAVNLAHDEKGPFLDVVEISDSVPCGLNFEFIQLAGSRPPNVGRRSYLDSPNPADTQARSLLAAQKQAAQEQIRREREAEEMTEADKANPYFNPDYYQGDPPEVHTFDGDIVNGRLVPTPPAPEPSEPDSVEEAD